MQHPDEGTIHAWLDGALPAEEAEAIARHVADCAHCAPVVADARGLIAGASRIVSSLDVVPGKVIPVTAAKSLPLWKRLRLTPARAAIAAAILVAATSVITVNRTPTSDLSKVGASEGLPIIKNADTTVAAPAAAPPTVVPTAPAKRRIPVTSIPPVSEPAAPKVEIAPMRASAPAARAADRAAAFDSARQAAEAEAANRSATRQMAPQSIELRSAAGAPGFAPRADASVSAEGCYRLSFDTTSWLRMLPQQFALSRDSSSGKNLVRGVTPGGAMDSIISNAEWRASANGSQVILSRTVASQPVSLRFAPVAGRGTALFANEARSVAVQRTACRP